MRGASALLSAIVSAVGQCEWQPVFTLASATATVVCVILSGVAVVQRVADVGVRASKTIEGALLSSGAASREAASIDYA